MTIDIEDIKIDNFDLNKALRGYNYVKDLILYERQINLDSQKIIQKKLNDKIRKLNKKYKLQLSKRKIFSIWANSKNKLGTLSIKLEKYLVKSSVRSRSGVLVSTIVLKPSEFSCNRSCPETDLKGNPTQPKSYVSSSLPNQAMLRATRYNFSVSGQLWDRIDSYTRTGNINGKAKAYKMELILSGWWYTLECYPQEYLELVMTEIYWAANNYGKNIDFSIDDAFLEDEQRSNRLSEYRIVGLTIETRPDEINEKSIKDYRRWGVTRVQLGFQSFDNKILKKINRGHSVRHSNKAIKMLKQCGYKIIGQVYSMPGPRCAVSEKDKENLRLTLYDPDYQVDELKIYPCTNVSTVIQSNREDRDVTSKIKGWYEKGIWKPYAEENLLKLYLINCRPWIRIPRMVRDFPRTVILSGYQKKSNLRQIINDELKKEGKWSYDIRSREIGDEIPPKYKVQLTVRKYKSSGGDEYFISYETCKCNFCWQYHLFNTFSYFQSIFTGKYLYWSGCKNYDKLIGFIRLRLDPNPGGGFIKELSHCSLVRELHVYGTSVGIGIKDKNYVQSKSMLSKAKNGYDKGLINTAEYISYYNGFYKVAIIASIGTRQYYRDYCGYGLSGTYMIKNILFLKKRNEDVSMGIMFLLVGICYYYIQVTVKSLYCQ
jgi:ELP3 family radical SAM enzyme/protein acetyltransferase